MRVARKTRYLEYPYPTLGSPIDWTLLFKNAWIIPMVYFSWWRRSKDQPYTLALTLSFSLLHTQAFCLRYIQSHSFHSNSLSSALPLPFSPCSLSTLDSLSLSRFLPPPLFPIFGPEILFVLRFFSSIS